MRSSAPAERGKIEFSSVEVWKRIAAEGLLAFRKCGESTPIPHFEKCRNRCGTAIGHTSTLENQEISLNA
jgi:hypothetical protein